MIAEALFIDGVQLKVMESFAEGLVPQNKKGFGEVESSLGLAYYESSRNDGRVFF